MISGQNTLENFPRAAEYAVHFRKTYYPICFHQNPAKEFEHHLAASKIIAIPPPIGSTRTTFRSCFLPGISYDRLTPFGTEPPERNIQIGEDMDKAAAIGLWHLLQQVYHQIRQLHERDFAHGDLFLHNVIVSPSPIGAHLIDFEQAVRCTDDLDSEKWNAIQQADLREIFKEAIYLQCALGRQTGTLAEASIASLPSLMEKSELFIRTIPSSSSALLFLSDSEAMPFQISAELRYTVFQRSTILLNLHALATPNQSINEESFTMTSEEACETFPLEIGENRYVRLDTCDVRDLSIYYNVRAETTPIGREPLPGLRSWR